MNRPIKTAALAAAVCAATLAATSWAGAASVESFDYPGVADGATLNGLAGGSGWANAWSKSGGGADLVVRPAAGLTFGTLDTAGGAVGESSATAGAAYARNSTVAALADGQSRWFSLLVNADTFGTADLSGAQGYVGLNASATGNATNQGNIVGFGFTDYDAAAGTYAIRAKGRATADFSATTVTLNLDETYLVVGRIDRVAGSNNDSVFIYLNPDIDSGTAPATASSSFTGEFTNAAGFQQFDVSTANAFVGLLDEVRVGDSFAEVTPVTPVPEPLSASAVALLGALGLRRPRRR